MAWFYRAFETADGTWSCRRDMTPVDEHITLNDAIAHLTKLAEEEDQPAYIYAHWFDGRVAPVGGGHE